MKIKRLHLCLVIPALFASLNAHAEEEDPIAKIGWKKIEAIDAFKPVKEKNGSQKPIELLELKKPKITEQNHAIGGEVRYSDVAGTGFLEMWTHYKDGSHFFSRTLGEFGPMAKLTGSSEWRPFLLPFFSDGKNLPGKLQVNLMLPGGGEVEFRNVGLYQLPGDRTGKASGGADAWWSDSFAAKFGAVGGSGIGFWGLLCGILTWAGKCRSLVSFSMLAAIVVGAISCVACVVAVFSRQPYVVWYPLLMLGGILLTLGAVGFACARRIYLNHELRAISAAG